VPASAIGTLLKPLLVIVFMTPIIVVVGGRVITSFLATAFMSFFLSAALDLNSTDDTSIVLVLANIPGSFLWLLRY